MAESGQFPLDNVVKAHGGLLEAAEQQRVIGACVHALLRANRDEDVLGFEYTLVDQFERAPEVVALLKGTWAAIAAAYIVPLSIYHGIAIADVPESTAGVTPARGNS